MKGYFIPAECMSGLAQDNLERSLNLLKGAHTIDITIRADGTNYTLQADWLKYVEKVKE